MNAIIADRLTKIYPGEKKLWIMPVLNWDKVRYSGFWDPMGPVRLPQSNF